MTLSNDDIDDEDDNNSLLLHQEPSSSLGPHEGGGGGTKTNNNSSSNDNNSSGSTTMNKSLRALTWGKKNAITIPLDRFTCVRKGKTTERTFRNGASASRLLSIVVSSSANNENDGASQQQQQQQQQQESLDIEAPTRLDRDKFASAFARFLGVPLIEEDEYEVEGSNGRVGRSGGGCELECHVVTCVFRLLFPSHIVVLTLELFSVCFIFHSEKKVKDTISYPKEEGLNSVI